MTGWVHKYLTQGNGLEVKRSGFRIKLLFFFGVVVVVVVVVVFVIVVVKA